MEAFMEFVVEWGKVYGAWIEKPLRAFLRAADMPVERASWFWIYDLIVTLLIYSLVTGVLRRCGKTWRKMRKRSVLVDEADYDAYIKKDLAFTDTLDAAQNPVNTIEPLKAAKRYDRVAQIYSSLNQPAEAAKWFRKAKDRKNEAVELARAGETLKAARLLMREGDYETAVRFFEDEGEHAQAAVAYTRMDSHREAAEAYLLAEKPDKAAQSFVRHFRENDTAPPSEQLKAAHACFNLIEEEEGAIKASVTAELMELLGPRFEESLWFYYAGAAYSKAGQCGDAVRMLRSVPPGDPNFQKAQHLLRMCCAREGDGDEL